MEVLLELELEINKALERINIELDKFSKIKTEDNSILVVAGSEEIISDKLIQYYAYLGQKLSFECVLDFINKYKEDIHYGV